MRKYLNKRSLGLAVALAAVTALAVAYWTTNGTGTGSGTTGDDAAVTVNQDSTVTGLTPGGTAQTLSGDFNNPNTGAVKVGAITATVTGTEKPAGTANPGCTAADFSITGTGAATGEIPPGNDQGSWSGLSIAMLDRTGVNQNACKDAVVKIAYSAAEGS